MESKTADAEPRADGSHNICLRERTDIQHLPNELLCAIFEHGASSVGDTPADLAQAAFEVTVSHVSQHWRQVALTSPSLWTNVHISFQRPFDQAMVYLERSKSCLIDITIDIRDEFSLDLSLVVAVLADCVDRWRRFVLKTPSYFELEPFVTRFLDGYAPHLEYLQLYTDSSYYEREGAVFLDDWDIFSAGTPKLSSLRLGGVGIPSCKSSLAELSFLDLTFPVDEPCLRYLQLHDVLVACKSLERLVLRGNLSMDYPDVELHPCTTLPSLLTLEMDITTIGTFCLLLETPALQTLSIQSSFCHDGETEKLKNSFWLSSGLPRFPGLHSLTLRGSDNMLDKQCMRALPHIRTLTLSPTVSDRILYLLAEASIVGAASSDILWPDLHTLVLHNVILVGDPFLRFLVSARSAAGRALSELDLERDSVREDTDSWLRKHVKLRYHEQTLEINRIAPDLSDVDWSDEDEDDYAGLTDPGDYWSDYMDDEDEDEGEDEEGAEGSDEEY